MKLIHKILSCHKGLSLLELVVAMGLMGGLALYLSDFKRNKSIFDLRMTEMNSLEDYASNFIKIIDFNESTDPQGNLCFSIFNGLNANLNTSTVGVHDLLENEVTGDDVLRIYPNDLDTLTGDKLFFNTRADGGYGFGDYRIDYLELSSGRPGVNNLRKINPSGGNLFEDIFQGSVHFSLTNLKTNEVLKTKKKTLFFGYGSDATELISCSGPTKLDLSLLGRCEIWGPYARVRNGECIIPRHRGLDATGEGINVAVDWEDPNKIYLDRTAKDTICELQSRSGVTEGSLCD